MTGFPAATGLLLLEPGEAVTVPVLLSSRLPAPLKAVTAQAFHAAWGDEAYAEARWNGGRAAGADLLAPPATQRGGSP